LEIVQRMNEALIHRGPDDEGSWAQDGFGFGMRRLSIIDLEGGHQPMWDDESGLGVVFNGEIYNYRTLREQLSQSGALFHTNSDTEVVLKTLALSGLSGIHSWNGMFAIAAWNPASERLLLIRDRVGVKPLYYYWDGANFLFASEIKALLASGLVERRINRQSVWDYLTFRYVPGPESIWLGVRKLPPGHALELLPGKAPREILYWETNVSSSNGDERPETEADLDKEFSELFLDSVEQRLVASDVPVGVLLSGGLDSSAIAAAAMELGHRNFHTFSVGFDEGGYYSELPHARKVAQHVGANYHEVLIGRDRFLELLPELVYYSDEPMADLAAIPLLEVSRLARQNVKVVLSGEGSDEILAGYDLGLSERRWQIARSLQRIPNPLLRLGSRFAGIVSPKHERRAKRIAEEPVALWNQTDRPHITRFLGQAEKVALWPAAAGQDSERILSELYRKASSTDPLQQLLSVYQKSWLVEDLLMKADKMSMATSVELRTPFLDYRLVEWANKQPNSVKVKRTGLFRYDTKSVLRRFCAPRLPKEILTRPKQGFPVPVNGWLTQGLDSWAQDILTGPNSRVAEAFSREILVGLVAGASQGDSEAAGDVWLLIVLEFWLQAWDASLA
ncbi:MAG: asparagine synthase (glutamine-hydrolyzing), partial [bacterium]